MNFSDEGWSQFALTEEEKAHAAMLMLGAMNDAWRRLVHVVREPKRRILGKVCWSDEYVEQISSATALRDIAAQFRQEYDGTCEFCLDADFTQPVPLALRS